MSQTKRPRSTKARKTSTALTPIANLAHEVADTAGARASAARAAIAERIDGVAVQVADGTTSISRRAGQGLTRAGKGLAKAGRAAAKVIRDRPIVVGAATLAGSALLVRLARR